MTPLDTAPGEYTVTEHRVVMFSGGIGSWAAAKRAITGTERRELLRRAEVRLHQAQGIDRIGYLSDSFVQDAADLLRDAGLPELADRLRDDDFGGDVRAVADEVTKLRGAMP